jgi:sugar lactone lactonase YvrE
MSYAETSKAAALYRWRSGAAHLQKIISGTTVSNGLAWSADKSKMYFIDSPTQSLQVFSYADGEILEKVEVFNFPKEYGYPDGMCIDSEDGLWVAFWMGSAVRRFDTKQGFKETHLINTPSARTTSCVFVGAHLDKLIITSAHMDDPITTESAGKTFICEPGVIGTATSQLIVD